MDHTGDLIPLLAVFCIFGLPIIGWIARRGMEHKERMALIARGFHPDSMDSRGWKEARREATHGAPRPDRVQRSLTGGIMTAAIGLALLIGLSFIGLDGEGWRPGPWLLGGLIPLFVGVAQVIGALLAGAQFPTSLRGNQSTQWQAPPAAPTSPWSTPPPPPAAPPQTGPYGYRPSGEHEELPRPTPPPKL